MTINAYPLSWPTPEQINAAFRKYGTGRPDGFAAAVRELFKEPRAPLTDAEIDRLDKQAIHGGPDSQYAFRFARALLAAHGISAERGSKND